ncbi:MAG: glycogen/starch synthase [Bacteroidales bacterium]|nr:glycogen/starch synthase [Bacteroidales bacterium]
MTDNNAKKVLFVSSEMTPYLPQSEMADIARFLPQGVQERKREIRAFMPRYGCINERKNQLHEVIRLSGMNLVISDVDRPLIIKVASITSARMQVYFIDNDDYFLRKGISRDSDGKFFADNDERAIFFARGVLETVKKLRWAPDVIHCQGWISLLVPMFMKRVYKDDPIFANSKIVFSLYDDALDESFSEDFSKKIVMGGISDKDVEFLSKNPDGTNLAKTAAKFSDGVILGSDKLSPLLVNYCRDRGLKVLPYKAKSIADGSYIEEYNAFYDQL